MSKENKKAIEWQSLRDDLGLIKCFIAIREKEIKSAKRSVERITKRMKRLEKGRTDEL